MSDYFNATGTIGFTCDSCGRETQGCTWVNGMKFCAKCYQETFGNTNPFEKELRDKIADLEAKLAESEEYNKMLLEEKSGYIDLISGYSKKCKNYEQQLAEITAEANARYDAWQEEIRECDRLRLALAEKDKNNLILYSMLYETLEKQGCENVASQIDQMTGFTLDKQAKWFKENRNCDELLKLLAEKEKEIDKLEDKLQSYYEETLNKGTCGLCEHLRGEYKTDFAIEQLEKVKELMRSIDMPNKPELYNNDMFGAGFDSHYIRVEKLIDNQIEQLKEKINVKD